MPDASDTQIGLNIMMISDDLPGPWERKRNWIAVDAFPAGLAYIDRDAVVAISPADHGSTIFLEGGGSIQVPGNTERIWQEMSHLGP